MTLNEYLGEAGGGKLRAVQGRGYFAGAQAQEQFAALEDLFLAGEPHSLILPGIRPFQAMFTALEEQHLGGGPALSYRFTFLETEALPLPSPLFTVMDTAPLGLFKQPDM